MTPLLQKDPLVHLRELSIPLQEGQPVRLEDTIDDEIKVFQELPQQVTEGTEVEGRTQRETL